MTAALGLRVDKATCEWHNRQYIMQSEAWHMNYWTQGPDNIYVAAHRGWWAKYPENTMEAFRAAVDLGVDQIETDVRVTKDGKLVLMHDPTLDRTTDHTGFVIEYALEELKKVDAGVKRGPEFAGCRIPELSELLELVKDHPTMTLDIELKEYPTEGREELAYDVCDRIIALLEQYGYGDRCVLNSFSGKLHEYIFKKYGKKLSVLHFDAHADLREEYFGDRRSHACALYPASRKVKVVQVGIRSVGLEEKKYVNTGNVKTFFMHENLDIDKQSIYHYIVPLMYYYLVLLILLYQQYFYWD